MNEVDCFPVADPPITALSSSREEGNGKGVGREVMRRFELNRYAIEVRAVAGFLQRNGGNLRD